jgi:hypothetical protein
MKKLLIITFSLFSFTFNYSQCIPDPTYADSTFGVWPTPQTNFSDGDIGVFYDEVVYFKIPRDAGNIDSAYVGQLIDSIILSSVSNLPPGLSYQCDIPSCTWNFDSVGCASISGTPTTNGSFQISLDATVWTEIFTVPFPVPYSFNGYFINIGPTSNNSLGSSFSNLILGNPLPNPSNNSTNIGYSSMNSGNISFQMTNLLGEIVHKENFVSNIGLNNISVNTSIFPNGVYLYSISNGLARSTKRLIVHH